MGSRWYNPPPTVVRICCGMSGTDVCYAATRYWPRRPSTTTTRRPRYLLRACYLPTRCLPTRPLPAYAPAICLRARYLPTSPLPAYALDMDRPVLTWRIGLPGTRASGACGLSGTYARITSRTRLCDPNSYITLDPIQPSNQYNPQSNTTLERKPRAYRLPQSPNPSPRRAKPEPILLPLLLAALSLHTRAGERAVIQESRLWLARSSLNGDGDMMLSKALQCGSACCAVRGCPSKDLSRVDGRVCGSLQASV